MCYLGYLFDGLLGKQVEVSLLQIAFLTAFVILSSQYMSVRYSSELKQVRL